MGQANTHKDWHSDYYTELALGPIQWKLDGVASLIADCPPS